MTQAIDEFGTGVSSLAALRSFSVSVLKIDRSFARHIRRAARGLRALGCVTGQRYGLGRPMPAAAHLERYEQGQNRTS